MRIKGALAGAVVGAAALAAGLSDPAAAQGAGAPPSWNTLVRCAEMGDSDARLACYDAAMRAAGHAPKSEAVAAEKRRRFGLRAPKLNLLQRNAKEEGARAEAEAPAGAAPAAAAAAAETPAPAPVKAQVEASPPPAETEDRVTVVLTRVDRLYDKRMLFFTSEGSLWEQTDTVRVEPAPRAGQTMTIRRTGFGGYFCDVNKWKAVRCERSR